MVRPGTVIRAMSRARFTVLPSEWYENSTMALPESLAAGLPAVRPQDPQARRVVEALEALARTPGVSPAAMRAVVDGIVLMQVK